MFSNIIEYIFENQQVKRTPVLNAIIWTFCFLKPELIFIAGHLDILMFSENEKRGISLF